jgi:hypothetical protein
MIFLWHFTKGSSSRNTGSVGVGKASRGDPISFDDARNSSGHNGFSMNSDPFSRVSSSFAREDVPDAASEKELVGSILFFPHHLCFGLGVGGGELNC